MDRECCQRERYKFALYNRFKLPKLYRYAMNGDWDLIPQRCETHPKEAQFVHAYAPSDTALHKILQTPVPEMDEASAQEHIQQVKLEAVAALLAAGRSAVPNSFGRTPLHVACMDVVNSGGEKVAYMIVELSPNSCSVQDVEGRTPLHYLVGRNDEIPLPLLAKVISIFPKALKMQDNVMETPLDIVTQRWDEIKDVDAIIQLLKDGEHQTGPQILGGRSKSDAKASDKTAPSAEFSTDKPGSGAARALTV
jgi:hypothetical protein